MTIVPVSFTKIGTRDIILQSVYDIAPSYKDFGINGYGDTPIFVRADAVFFSGLSSFSNYAVTLVGLSSATYYDTGYVGAQDVVGLWYNNTAYFMGGRSYTSPTADNEIIFSTGNGTLSLATVILSIPTIPDNGVITGSLFPNGLNTVSAYLGRPGTIFETEVYMVTTDGVSTIVTNAFAFDDISEHQAYLKYVGPVSVYNGTSFFMYNQPNYDIRPGYIVFSSTAFSLGGPFTYTLFEMVFDDPDIDGGDFLLAGISDTDVYYGCDTVGGDSVILRVPLFSNTYEVITSNIFSVGIFLGGDYYSFGDNGGNLSFYTLGNVDRPLFTRNPRPVKLECGNYCVPLLKQRKNYK